MRLLTSLAILWSYAIIQIGSSGISQVYSSAPTDLERPYAFCISQINLPLMDVTGVVTIDAKDIEAGLSSDNLTSYQNLRFSFSKDQRDQKRTYDCNDVGTRIIELWVSDEAGNQDYCTTVISISDPHEVCGMSTRSSSLAGL